jgi:hypothetical protein
MPVKTRSSTKKCGIAPIALLFFLVAGGAVNASAVSYEARLEKTQYRGWAAYKLANGIVSLYVTPQLGGRAIQLQLGDQEFFFVNKELEGKVLPESENNVKAGWANYGGDKVWPAPEGWMNDNEWPSIPYYVLDGSEFQIQVVKQSPEEVAVRVTSPADRRTGVQFVRTYHVYAGTTRVTVEQVMRNISRRQVRWGIWHLIQNDAADAHGSSKPNPELYMYIPLHPHSRFPKGYYMPYGDARHPSYEVLAGGQMLRVHYLYRVGKAAADSNAGWYAVVNGQKNIGYVETFKHFPDMEYPDGASVETWNDGPGTISRGPWDQTLVDDPRKTPYFLEAEVISPFAKLEPGDEYEFTVNWWPTRVPNPIRDAVGGGAISEPFGAAEESRNTRRLRGIFGVFVPGTLRATFYSVMGEELGHETLMAVDPREVVRLDKTVPAPAGAFRVSISVHDADGENRGFLGNVILKHR